MATPGVRAKCEDLRADAKKWSTAADALRGASQTAAGLTLADKLGPLLELAGSGKSLAGYDEFRQKMTAALSGGADAFTHVSTILVQVADTYEREDRQGAHRLARARGSR